MNFPLRSECPRHPILAHLRIEQPEVRPMGLSFASTVPISTGLEITKKLPAVAKLTHF